MVNSAPCGWWHRKTSFSLLQGQARWVTVDVHNCLGYLCPQLCQEGKSGHRPAKGFGALCKVIEDIPVYSRACSIIAAGLHWVTVTQEHDCFPQWCWEDLWWPCTPAASQLDWEVKLPGCCSYRDHIGSVVNETVQGNAYRHSPITVTTTFLKFQIWFLTEANLVLNSQSLTW